MCSLTLSRVVFLAQLRTAKLFWHFAFSILHFPFCNAKPQLISGPMLQ